MKQFSLFSASVARMELRGIRDLWLTIARRFRGIPPDSAALHPGYAGWIPAFTGMKVSSCSHGKSSNNSVVGCGERSEPHQPRLCHLMRFAALTTSYALSALVVDPHKSAWRSGLPLSQRGNEGDLATFAWVTVLEIPPNPPLEKGGIRAPTSLTANADRVGYTDLHSGIHATFPLASRQAGAALITSLIFLTVLTILGMSTLGTALLESRMAGNARDRNLAFQAAEIGLRDAELFIRDAGRIDGNILVEMGTDAGDYTGQTCTFGFCHNGKTWVTTGKDWITTPVWDVTGNWTKAIQYHRDGQAADEKVVGYAGTAQLVVNADYDPPTAGLPLVRRQPEYLIESFSPKPLDTHYYYRITVRGYGMRPGTRVMLQEVYTPN